MSVRSNATPRGMIVRRETAEQNSAYGYTLNALFIVMAISLRICLLEGAVQRVRNQEFFWAPSRQDEKIKPGYKIPGRRFQHSEAEEYLEKVRREEFPDRPSRDGAIFLSTSPVVDWASHYANVYRVRATGLIFLASSENFSGYLHNFQMMKLMRPDSKVYQEYARQYWQESESLYHLENADSWQEVILQGEAVVEDLVDKPAPDDPVWDEKTVDIKVDER